MPDKPDLLDELIDRQLDQPGTPVRTTEAEVQRAAELATELIHLPREEFREGLLVELLRSNMRTINYTPAGLAAVTPYVAVSDTGAAIRFYEEVFGAEEVMRHDAGGQIVHAKVRIDDSVIELGQAGSRTAADAGLMPPIALHLYVEDVDEVYTRALAAGARSLSDVEEQFYGDREVSIADPFGIVWYVATHVRD